MSGDEPEIETDDVFDSLSEPYLATFTGRIPFLLGIPDRLGHTISFPHPFVDPVAAEQYGPHPTVDIRVFTLKTPGILTQTPGAAAALKHFHNYDLPQDIPKRFAEDGLADYEQWVTLSTQGAIAAGEEPRDRAYTFHRALNVFNVFIESVMVATQDFRLRTVVAHDFKPGIVIGAITLRNGRWQHLTDMMMFPDFPQREAMLAKPAFPEAVFREGLRRIQNNAPFVRSLLWRGRVEDALRTGDSASAIVGLQTAAEAFLFDTYTMLLVDDGNSKQEIDQQLASEPAFATLVKTLLKDKLGGHWDPTLLATPVGRYWEKLYQVRNDVVHRGFEPHFGHAEEARDAYVGLVDFVASRVREKARRYPRTLLALVGEEGLRERGWLSSWIRRFVAEANAESAPFFQPWDQAGRPAPVRDP